MTSENIDSRISLILEPVNEFENLTKITVNSIKEDSKDLLNSFKQDIDLRVSRIETVLSDGVAVIALSANYHIDRCYFQASPGLIAIITGIYNVVKGVIGIIKVLTNTKVFQVIMAVHKIAYALWPEYKKAIDQAVRELSKISKELGLGIDGLNNFLNAVNSSISAMSGLMGWDWEGFRGEYYENFRKYSLMAAKYARGISDDPLYFINGWLYNQKLEESRQANVKWANITDSITNVANVTEKFVTDISQVVDDIEKLESSLPEFIRKNIPQSILDGIAKADYWINEKILPSLDFVRETMDEINSVLDAYRNKTNSLIDKLTHPGSVLLGVDDLPDYAKNQQLSMIDDVTSRKLMEQAEADKEAMSNEIQQLESIAEAMTAPTPEPGFLLFESPERQALSGIVVEPQETWMIGGYNSPY